MKCLCCDAQWNIGNEKMTFSNSCPICDMDYIGYSENRQFETIEELLCVLIMEKGIDICLDSNIVNAYLNDYFPAKHDEREDVSKLLANGIGQYVHSVLTKELSLVDWSAKISDIDTVTSKSEIIGVLNRLSGMEKFRGTDFGSVDYYLSQLHSVKEEYKSLALDKAHKCDKDNQKVLNLIAQENLKSGNTDQALKALEQSIANGDIDSIYIVSDYYLKGQFVKKDKAKAEEYLKLAQEKGDIKATYKLGVLHITPPEVDLKKATEYFLKASDFGIVEADYVLYGLMYTKTDDKDEALKYLTKAVSKEYMPAVYDYAIRRLYGDEMSQSINQAISLLESIAEKGYYDAIDKLEYMYNTGFKVKKDKDKAKMYRLMKGN